jgi:hypothetical protein
MEIFAAYDWKPFQSCFLKKKICNRCSAANLGYACKLFGGLGLPACLGGDRDCTNSTEGLSQIII